MTLSGAKFYDAVKIARETIEKLWKNAVFLKYLKNKHIDPHKFWCSPVKYFCTNILYKFEGKISDQIFSTPFFVQWTFSKKLLFYFIIKI